MGTLRDVPSHCKDLIPGFLSSQHHRKRPWYVHERQSKGQGLQLALHGKEMHLVGINRKMFHLEVDVKEYRVVFCYTWGGYFHTPDNQEIKTLGYIRMAVRGRSRGSHSRSFSASEGLS